MEILEAEQRRYSHPVDAAAYFTVAEALGYAARRGVSKAALSVTGDGARLIVTIEHDGTGDTAPMVAAADRVGSLGGNLATEPNMCRAEIPCASS